MNRPRRLGILRSGSLSYAWPAVIRALAYGFLVGGSVLLSAPVQPYAGEPPV